MALLIQDIKIILAVMQTQWQDYEVRQAMNRVEKEIDGVVEEMMYGLDGEADIEYHVEQTGRGDA